MSKQTALTKAIERINSLINMYDGMDNAVTCFKDSIQILTDLLPYEREVIEDAYSDGVNDEAFGRLLGSVADNSTDYFTKTFTDNGNEL